jgi:RNA binding exosome subunit
MKAVNLNFEGNFNNGNVVAIAEVKANSENEASSLLDSFLEENHPELGREESHFEENNTYFFRVVK